MLKVRSLKGRLAAAAGILAGYAAVQLLVPVPGIGAGVLTPEGTINGWIDRLLLPGRLYDKVFDPEGILCILSATSVTLMGGLAGLLLKSGKLAAYRKALVLAAAGLGLTTLGYVLGGWYPIIKKAWTATFDIYAAGLVAHPAGAVLPGHRRRGPEEVVVLFPDHRAELDRDLPGDADDRFRATRAGSGSAGWPGSPATRAPSSSSRGRSPSSGWSSISSTKKNVFLRV